MDGLIFHLKRAWQSVLYRFSHPALKPFGVTPARFDMLVAIKGGVTQVGLRELLGVTAPVITRMVQALERLALIVRRVEGRTRWVELTKLGVSCVKMASAALMGPFGKAQERIGLALAPMDVSLLGMEERGALDEHLEALRRGFGDCAGLAFPSQYEGLDETG